jgi:hypothetical protein
VPRRAGRDADGEEPAAEAALERPRKIEVAPVAAIEERSLSSGLREIDVDQGVVVAVEDDMGRGCRRISWGQASPPFSM